MKAFLFALCAGLLIGGVASGITRAVDAGAQSPEYTPPPVSERRTDVECWW
jgi:hypothetical protein